MAEEVNPAPNDANNNKVPELDPNLVNPLDKQNKAKSDTKLLKNIVSTVSGKNDKKILEDAPELDASVLKDVEPPKSLLLVTLKMIFGLGLVASVASFLFFTAQLESFLDPSLQRFGFQSVKNQLSAGNQEILSLKTNQNVFRYLQAKSFLDNFSYKADQYLLNFEVAHNKTVPESERNAAKESLSKLKEDLQLYLEKAKEKLKDPLHVKLVDEENSDPAMLSSLFETELKKELQRKVKEFANNQDDPTVRSSYKNHLQTVNLVANKNLRSLILSSDLAAMEDGESYELVKDIGDLIVNDLSTIQEVKSKRIKWSDIMNEITLRTSAVDNYYNGDFYDELGGIRYSSYDFDSVNGKITVVGETKRFDTRNFTMIADLIDELNQSRILENGEMRSFSKSGSLDTGYTATLKLTLDIEEEDFSDPEFNLDLK